MKKYSLGALVAAGLLMGGLGAGSASAADLGGNCCADLEERIAELEATTARKGNRKVSLTVSGWVGEQVMWWDDGGEQNTYVVGLGTTLASHVKFTGQATIMPGWYAGYVLHIEAIDSDSLTIGQSTPVGPNIVPAVFGKPISPYTTTVLQSFWFIKSDHLGKVSVGLQSQASDNTAILVDGSGSLVPANWVAFDYRAFSIRRSDGNLSNMIWGANGRCVGGGAIGDCNGLTQEVVRYDSPTFAGFSMSASWGLDDMWDVAARYAGEHAGFKVAVAAAYNQIALDAFGVPSFFSATASKEWFKYFQVGAYVEHVPTGVFAYGAYGHNEADLTTGDANIWYGKAGLRERWNHLGHTVLYGEYEQADGNDGFALYDVAAPGVGADSTSRMWGLGVVQEIDAAAMSVWLSYRHLDFDNNEVRAYNFEDFQYVKGGALINF